MEGKQQKKTVHYFSFINSPSRQLLEEYDSISLHFIFLTAGTKGDLRRRLDMFSLFFHIRFEGFQKYLGKRTEFD